MKFETLAHAVMLAAFSALTIAFGINYIWTLKMALRYERDGLWQTDARTASTWFLTCFIAGVAAITFDIVMSSRSRSRGNRLVGQ